MLFLAGRPAPKGWSRIGPVGPNAGCLAYIDPHQLDMLSKNLRDGMAGTAPGAPIVLIS
nr:hypothetical protein [uncultured Rhodopila sp.]